MVAHLREVLIIHALEEHRLANQPIRRRSPLRVMSDTHFFQGMHCGGIQ